MSDTTYTRTYRDFRGVDFSSKRSECDPHRFNYLVNMWRDYHSEQGAGVETAPGFRRLLPEETTTGNGKIHSLQYLPAVGETGARIIAHSGTKLYAYDFDKKEYSELSGITLEDAPSRSILYRDKILLVDGEKYIAIEQGSDAPEAVSAETDAYIPITYLNGNPYEQKNMLTDLYIEKFGKEPSYTSDDDKILHYVLSEMSDRLCQESTGKGIYIKNTRGKEIRLYPFKVQAPPYTDENANLWYDYGVEFLTPYTDPHGNLASLDDVSPENNPNTKYIDTPIDWDAKLENVEGTIEIRSMSAKDSLGGGVIDNYKRFFFLKPLCSGTPKGYFLGFVGEETSSTENANFYSFKFDEKDLSYCGGVERITEIYFSFRPLPIINTAADIAEVVIHGTSKPNSFTTVGDMRDALSGNPDFIGNTSSAADAINGCTLIAEFDGRIFFSGNPKLPNSVFYTQRDLTGYNNPFYVGCYNYLNDGTGRTPITAMITTPTQLIVLKDDVAQGSSIYYHYAQDNTAENKITRDLQPRIYPRENGVPGVGCLGLACNFRDDPVFLSPYGLEAIGKSQVNLERTLAHRSSMVDARLINEPLRGAVCAEWDGYLCILVPGGKMYLADSRQVFTHKTGDQQYEWYYWDGIGVWPSQTDRYYYVSQFPGAPDALGGYEVAWKDEITPAEGEVFKDGDYTYIKGAVDGVEYAYIVDCYGEKVGGTFKQATALLSVDGLLYFGCDDGSLCVFNIDMRDEDHLLKPEAFTQNGRRYLSGCATLSDDCGRANLVKSTVKGSLTVVTKSFPYALVDVRVRTNAVPWYECDKIYAGEVDYSHTDFAAFAFRDKDDGCIAIVREREKRWVEKQLYFLTECYESPFGIISATFDYKIAGRYRNG